MPRLKRIVALQLFSVALVCAQTRTTIHHHSVETTEASPDAEVLKQAESEIVNNNFAKAEPLLQQAVSKDPKDFQAWYDLGFVEDSLHKPAQAISAYQKSVELNPKIFESNLNLGLLLAQQGQDEEAQKYLHAATGLKPAAQPEISMERAWLALGKVLEPTSPAEARSAFEQAGKRQPRDPSPHLSLARLLEKQGQLGPAQSEYKRAVELSRGDDKKQALAGLVNAAIARNSGGEAETALRDYLRESPEDPTAHLLLGRVLVTENKKEEALNELDLATKAGAVDPEMLQEKAELLSQLNRYEEAAGLYKQMLQQLPKDASLHHQYAVVLMQQHHFAEAQPELLAAIKLDPTLAPAYGDLAVTASENKQFSLTIQALDARAKMMPETAATHFLRATAYDHLKQFPQATAEYKQFLLASNGKYPDREWQARHRLIAIEKLK